MKSNNSANILVAAGGTGGHLFPALAVVESLRELTDNRINPIFVGNPERLESRIVPGLGYSFNPLSVVGFGGLFSLKTLTLPFKIMQSVSTCKRLIKENDIKAVICAGAYLSYPAGLAASKTGIPLILMESNVFPGKTIRLLADKAERIITSFAQTSKFFSDSIAEKITCLGNPVRNRFDGMPSRESACASFGLDASRRVLFVFGGSLGARSINSAVDKFVDSEASKGINIIWQTGNNYTPIAKERPGLRILKFIDNMETAYAAADLVVSRSGATSIAEICLLGKPSVLVPLPTASNDEQASNASALVEASAAVLIRDAEIGERFAGEVISLLGDDERRAAMGAGAHMLAKPNAASDAAKEILSLI